MSRNNSLYIFSISQTLPDFTSSCKLHFSSIVIKYKVVFFSQVEGGSGNFTWASSNETVAMVTTKGLVTAGQVRGNSTVVARDVQNPFRYGEMKVGNFPKNLLITPEILLPKFTSFLFLLSKFKYSNTFKIIF